MKITENQIQQLYQFTRQHYVYHYDVQTELVDHLANDIEEIWEENPNLTFEQARDKAFKKFGIFGFMDVVEEKQKQMNKRYWKLLLRFVKEWFQLPKILITILIFLTLFFLIQLKEFFIFLIITLLVLIVFDVLVNLIISFKIKKIKKRKQPLFLLEEMIHKTQRNTFMLLLFNCFNIFVFFAPSINSLSIHWLVFLCFLFTIIIISFYIIEFIIPKKAEELLQETYPEYKIVKSL